MNIHEKLCVKLVIYKVKYLLVYRSARTHTRAHTYECFRSFSLPLSVLFWSLITFPSCIAYLAPVVLFYPDTVFYLCGGFRLFTDLFQHLANPSGYAIQCVGLRLLACWDCCFKSYLRHGCLCLLSVACCQVGFSVSG